MKYDSWWLSDSWGIKKNHWFTNSRCLSHFAAPQRCGFRQISSWSWEQQTTWKQALRCEKQGSWGTRNKRVSHNWSRHYSRDHQHGGKKNKETNQGKTRGRHPSANRERQPQQTSVMRKLDYTSRFVRVISTLSPNQSSHNSIGHGGRYNMVVTVSTLNTIPYCIVKKNYSRHVKHGSQEQYDHFKANESTRHVEKKHFSSITERFHKKNVLYRNSQLVIGWTEEHCQYLDSLMAITFSHTATRKERQRSASVVKGRNLGQWRKGQIVTSSKQTSGSEKTSGESKSVYPWTFTIPTATNWRTWKDWNSNGNVGGGTSGLNLLPLLQPGGRHKSGKTNLFSFAL